MAHYLIYWKPATVIDSEHLPTIQYSASNQYFVGFGSLAGRFGGRGQVDYSAANELRAKLVSGFRLERPDCAAFTVDWPAWEDVGMAARPASRARLSRLGHRFLVPQEGIRWVLHELADGAPDAELVIVDPCERAADLETRRVGM